MYIAPGKGRKILGDKLLMSTEKPLSLRPFVASFKQISLKSDFIHKFFMFLYMYIAPQQWQTTPWGQNFYININLL